MRRYTKQSVVNINKQMKSIYKMIKQKPQQTKQNIRRMAKLEKLDKKKLEVLGKLAQYDIPYISNWETYDTFATTDTSGEYRFERSLQKLFQGMEKEEIQEFMTVKDMSVEDVLYVLEQHFNERIGYIMSSQNVMVHTYKTKKGIKRSIIKNKLDEEVWRTRAMKRLKATLNIIRRDRKKYINVNSKHHREAMKIKI